MENKPNMSSSSVGSIETNDKTEDIAVFVQSLLQQVQDKFQQMSDQILNRIDEMGHRIDDLEHNLNELMAQTDGNEENQNNNSLNNDQINK
jgi:heat shock factor-binding protein 1